MYITPKVDVNHLFTETQLVYFKHIYNTQHWYHVLQMYDHWYLFRSEKRLLSCK